jgi:hypothetical protein
VNGAFILKLFQFGGGEIVSTPGDYGITLIPPEVVLIGNDEVFSTHYIKDCCTRNKLLNLGLYRYEFYGKVASVNWYFLSTYEFVFIS